MKTLEAWDARLGAAVREGGSGGGGGGGNAGGLAAHQRLFWTNVCICNTLIVERGPDGEYVYQVHTYCVGKDTPKRTPLARRATPWIQIVHDLH